MTGDGQCVEPTSVTRVGSGELAGIATKTIELGSQPDAMVERDSLRAHGRKPWQPAAPRSGAAVSASCLEGIS